MTCADFLNPLDLECLLVNNFSGTWLIFGLLALVGIIMLSGRFRMSGAVLGGGIMLFSILMYDQLNWLVYLSLFVGGLTIWIIIANVLKR